MLKLNRIDYVKQGQAQQKPKFHHVKQLDVTNMRHCWFAITIVNKGWSNTGKLAIRLEKLSILKNKSQKWTVVKDFTTSRDLVFDGWDDANWQPNGTTIKPKFGIYGQSNVTSENTYQGGAILFSDVSYSLESLKK